VLMGGDYSRHAGAARVKCGVASVRASGKKQLTLRKLTTETTETRFWWFRWFILEGEIFSQRD